MLLRYGDLERYQNHVIPVSPCVVPEELQPNHPKPQYRNKVFPPDQEKAVSLRFE